MLYPTNISLAGPASATLGQALASIPPDAVAPARAQSFLTELYRVAALVGLDPAVLAAQSREETAAWRSNVWRDDGNPAGMRTADGSDYVSFASPANAARCQVVHMCAYVFNAIPAAASDYAGLDPRYRIAADAYGGTVKHLSDLGHGRWAEDPNYAQNIADHLEVIRGDATDAAPPKPPIVDMSDCPHQSERTEGIHPQAIVYHCTNDRAFESTRSWFFNAASTASANYVIDTDGTIYRFVDPTRQAWGNNDVKNPRTDIALLNRAIAWGQRGLPYSVNDWTISIEHVGVTGETFAEAQYASTIALSRRLLHDFGIRAGRGHQWRHSDINGCSPAQGCNADTGRWYCPGPSFDFGQIIMACGGDPGDLSS